MASDANSILRLTRQQVRQVDRLAIERYGIPGIVLMENAARNCADAATQMLQAAHGHRVLVLCGGGNNGGDGLAIARHLHNRGFSVAIALTIDPARYSGDALINWQIVQRMDLPVHQATPASIAALPGDLLIDAIFGTGLSQAPRPPFDQIAAAVNNSARPVLAVDVPSGLDCDTGQPLGPAIRATRTVTFVAEKTGFATPESRTWTGPITVADIGCPPQIVQEILTRS